VTAPLTVGICLGDVTGIGPEVTLKALARVLPEDDTRYVLIGDRAVIHHYSGLLGCRVEYPEWPRFPRGTSQITDPVDWSDWFQRTRTRSEYESGAELQPDLKPSQEQVFNPGTSHRVWMMAPATELPQNLDRGDPLAARAAVESLDLGVAGCLHGDLQALVTAPVNKAAIMQAGIPFVGQTEYLAERSGTSHVAMMLLGQDPEGRWLRVALATTHVALSEVTSVLKPSTVESVIHLTVEACRLLGLPRRRVGVCGLNPHAGESGYLGREEIDWLIPLIDELKRSGLDVQGPIAADALFRHAYLGGYDAVVAMYHDQGLVPLKMVAFETGVNWTLGLPFIRTSPDHGTAYDLAGSGQADPSSMIAAIRLAKQLAARTRDLQRA